MHYVHIFIFLGHILSILTGVCRLMSVVASTKVMASAAWVLCGEMDETFVSFVNFLSFSTSTLVYVNPTRVHLVHRLKNPTLELPKAVRSGIRDPRINTWLSFAHSCSMQYVHVSVF